MSTVSLAPPGRGMVATSQTHAVAAGLELLAAGGNAADAAIATAAALAVTEPTSGGLGGDCFALHHDAATRQVTALDGSGRAPAALSIERLDREGLGAALPPFHPHTVTVPGACAGWFDLAARHGSRPMSELLAPAIRLAADGFQVGPITAHHWAIGAQAQLAHTRHGHELLIDRTRAPRAGERFTNPALARVLASLASGGPDQLYRGWIGDAIVEAVRDAGGALDRGDLESHASTWETPISARFGGVTIWECPPAGQGLAALLALGILDALGPERVGPAGSVDRLHHVIEALRLAFADTLWFAADPAFAPAPVAALLDPAYAARRAALIDPARALPATRGDPQSLVGRAGADTYYLTAVDRAGNACSFIQSNYMGFGTGIVPRGTGFSLQNRGHCFSLDPAHPNALAPGKRPFHTIIPALATAADGTLEASFGVMGGFMQPQGHVQVALALWRDRVPPQEALDRPRLHVDPQRAASHVSLEEGTDPRAAEELAARGHLIRMVTGADRALFGRGQIIARQPDGSLAGGSDRRADGCAAAEP